MVESVHEYPLFPAVPVPGAVHKQVIIEPTITPSLVTATNFAFPYATPIHPFGQAVCTAALLVQLLPSVLSIAPGLSQHPTATKIPPPYVTPTKLRDTGSAAVTAHVTASELYITPVPDDTADATATHTPLP